MKVNKRITKRQTLRTQHKIKRKVKEHNKKLRQAARKNPGQRKKLSRDPGIPNLWPFKEELIAEVQEQRAKLEHERELAKEKRAILQSQARSRPSSDEKEQIRMAELSAAANKRAAAFDGSKGKGQESSAGVDVEGIEHEHEGSRKAFARELHKVIDAADVILEIVDARDPQGGRSAELEEAVRQAGAEKRLVVVMNKADLIPKNIAVQWLKALRSEVPAVAFAAQKSAGYSRTGHVLVGSSLLQLLKNYCRNRNIKTSITVGIVGMPNVGKSSIINALKRSRAVVVGSTPGVTRSMQTVSLDKQIKLVDCPGLLLSKSDSYSSSLASILRNAVNIQQLDDPIRPVQALMSRFSKAHLMAHYAISDYESVEQFLDLVARRRGKVKKGGIGDRDAAARIVINDWNRGKLKWFTPPPESGAVSRTDRDGDSVSASAAVVTAWGKEFDFDAIESVVVEGKEGEGGGEGEGEMVDEGDSDGEFVQMDPSDVQFGSMEEEEEEEAMDDEKEEVPTLVPTVPVPVPKTKKANANPALQGAKASKRMVTEEDELNPQIGKQRKKAMKKAKKERRRGEGVGGGVGMEVDGEDEIGMSMGRQPFDFSDFATTEDDAEADADAEAGDDIEQDVV